MLTELNYTNVGCNVGERGINMLAYADDIVLCAPSWRALQRLIDLLSLHVVNIQLSCNVRKTKCMVFAPKQKSKIIAKEIPIPGGPKKRGHSTFSQISRKLLKISK